MAQDWPEDEPVEAPGGPQGHPRGQLTPAIAEALCGLIAAGRTVPKAAAACGISENVFWRHHSVDPSFRLAVQQARQMGIERLADEILEIAEEKSDPRHRQVRIDARKWLLSKLLPKRYGDKVDLTVSQSKPLEQMTDAELYERLRHLEGAARVAASAGSTDEPATVH